MEVELIWEEITKDQDGFAVKKKRAVSAFAEEKTVKRSEAYEAMRSGVSVQTVLEIRQEDWEETMHIVNGKKEYARKVQFDGCEYDIVRAYKKNKAKIELSCG